jgi:transposase
MDLARRKAMTGNEVLSELLALPGVKVTGYRLQGEQEIVLDIESTSRVAVCPRCQQLSTELRDYNEAVKIRDLALWNRRCWLNYRPPRFRCEHCHQLFNERVVWRQVGYTYTVRYEQPVYGRSRREPLANVAADEGLSEQVVQALFTRWAKKQ